MTYEEFLSQKALVHESEGLEPSEPHEILFPFQRDIVKWALRRGRACIFADCVAGDTIVAGANERIDVLAQRGEPIRVISRNGKETCAAWATAPWVNGFDSVFLVTTASGKNIKATLRHKLLTPSGWLPLASLQIGSRLLVSESAPSPSILECAPSTPTVGDRSSWKTPPDLRVGYSACFRPCGEPLHSQSSSVRALTPLLNDVPGHTLFRERMGDRELKGIGSRHGQYSSRLPTPDSLCQRETCYAAVEEYSGVSLVPKLLSSSALSPYRYQESSSPEQLGSEYDLWFADQTSAGDLFSSWDTITAIEYVGNELFYDLHVPLFENYLANGFWSHNCGMGKTFMQIEWARQIPGDVLILAPLAVATQTIDEAAKLGCFARYCRDGADVQPGITITNYEMLEHFDTSRFVGVVLDESSIIKHFEGKFRNLLIKQFSTTPYRLACTATPAPNDHMELGNHAEFVGAMSRTEMLSMFFVHDGGDTAKWRLKGHAETEFWKWVCSWAVMICKPSDLGYEDGAFVLPPMILEQISIEHQNTGEFLFAMEAQTLQERISARRESVSDRVARCAEMVNASDEQWLIWCNLNTEADELELAINDAVQVKGSERPEWKASKLHKFARGEMRVLVTKPSIAAWGLNFQSCRNVAFVGLSDSWESYYQAVRRCWRFGQTKTVRVHIITSTAEGQVVANIKRKEADAARMAEEMVKHMHSINEANIKGLDRTSDAYVEDVARGDRFELHLGDCVDVVRKIPDESVGFSIFSPPFKSLYTYSASDRDMGNSKNDEEFAQHFDFLSRELYRVTMPGRLLSFHCMNLPTSKSHHGFIGIHDFRGELIRCFQSAGFIFHSEVCIWKDPVTAMQRTKALGLLHKQLVKDSCMSRQGVPDYLVTMRKPGENQNPVEGELDRWIGDSSFRNEGRLSIDIWQRFASPVWMDINPSRTLQKESARDDKDERHICPLQLDVIERAMELWSNPGDLVLSPFAGIGSEGWVALKNGRRFVGAELKASYWKQAASNLAQAEQDAERDFFTELVAV